MTVLGVLLRRRRLEGPGSRMFLLGLDHGLPAGPLDGIEDPGALVRNLRDVPLTGTILNPGMVRRVASETRAETAIIVHLSGGTLLGSQPESKVAIGSVAGAIALGADVVSVQVHFGHSAEDRMLATAGEIIADAHAYGLPTLVIAYAPSTAEKASADIDAAQHAARAAAEMGADVVQSNYLGPAESIPDLVRACPVPLLLAGGPRSRSLGAFLDRIRGAVAAGAAGITVGRNLFQHPDPRGFAMQIGEVVFQGASPPIAVEVPR